MTSGRERPPGPRGGWLLGSLPRLRADPLRFYREIAAEYGPIARFRLGPYQLHLINDPESIRYVLQHDGDRFRKGFGNGVLAPLIGEGLFLSEGERWRQHRAIVAPLFGKPNLERLVPVIFDAVSRMLDEWEPRVVRGETLDIHHELRELTLRIISRALVGCAIFDDSPTLRAELEQVWTITNQRIAVPWLDALHLRRESRFKRGVRELNAVIGEAIRERRSTSSGDEDLLGLLLSARSKDGTTLDERAVRDEVITFLIAGQECTSIVMSWTLWLLATHPDEERRVREEIAGVSGEVTPSLADLPRNKRICNAIDEAMRLYPPAWMMARQSEREERVCGYSLPPGAILMISPWVTHRDPRFWPEPDRFDPDRFTGAKPDHGQYFPFSLGPRSCVGRPLALVLARMILPMVLRRYQMAPVAGHPVEPAPLLTLRPRHGIAMSLRPVAPG